MIENIGKKIEEEIKEQGRTMTYIAKKTGMSLANLSKTLKRMEGGENITLNKLQKIAEALGKPLSFFLNEKVDR